MQKKTVLVITILTILILATALGVASAHGEGEPIELIAEDLCSINSSLKLLTYAVIALVLVQLAGLVPLFKKK